jgi:hypothetical protein
MSVQNHEVFLSLHKGVVASGEVIEHALKGISKPVYLPQLVLNLDTGVSKSLLKTRVNIREARYLIKNDLLELFKFSRSLLAKPILRLVL